MEARQQPCLSRLAVAANRYKRLHQVHFLLLTGISVTLTSSSHRCFYSQSTKNEHGPAICFSDPPGPLPLAIGPKLAPFTPTARAEIEFIAQIGDPEVDQDGHVWKVRINGNKRLYALRMIGPLSWLHVQVEG